MKKFRFLFTGQIDERTMKQLLNGELKGIHLAAMELAEGKFEVVPEICDKCKQTINPTQ